jgi:tRNA1(Val) A37 N6-methylase TrmN6
MERHGTPGAVASALARYAPKRIKNLLDPSVGKGNLLSPFTRRKYQPKLITCVDRDGRVANELRARIEPDLRSKLNFIRSDFFDWANLRGIRAVQFDCIVVNPPFCGRKWVSIRPAGHARNKRATQKAPIELAFLLKCIELLSDSGRLLAILPSSAVTCANTRWFREFLLRAGSVKLVHEIPPKTFQGVEGRMFLLVFDKNRNQRALTLCNSDLFRPRKLRVPISRLRADLRMDYSFHKAQTNCVRAGVPSSKAKRLIRWVPLAQVAGLKRGRIEAPFRLHVMHTTDREGPFWIVVDRKWSVEADVRARQNDIIISRVGRNCASSLGIYCNKKYVPISDCLIIIRAKIRETAPQLLFSLRVLVKWPGTAALLERGTGASYITLDSLGALNVPWNLHSIFPKEFRSYIEALRMRRAKRMCDIELAVSEALNYLEV